MLGALIEKGLATPQNYPLSLNALVAACNQTTNRDPITDLGESEVERLLEEAKVDGLARFVHPRSGRGVTKYRHVVDEVLRLEPGELALIGVLLLRGPQTVNELRTRTERLAPFGDNTEVEQALDALARREPRGLVVRLEREPGHRERRWIQLLCPAQGDDRSGVLSGGPGPTAAAGSDQLQPQADSSVPISAGMPDPFAETPDGGTRSAGEADRVEPQQQSNQSQVVDELRAEVAELSAELAELRAAFDEFRRQFD